MSELDRERAKAVGRRIAEARLQQGGMTQRELADLLNVSERSMQGYEIGEVIPYRLMPELSRILQKDVAWFLHGDTESPDLAALLEAMRRLTDEVSAIRRLLEEREPPNDHPQVVHLSR